MCSLDQQNINNAYVSGMQVRKLAALYFCVVLIK